MVDFDKIVKDIEIDKTQHTAKKRVVDAVKTKGSLLGVEGSMDYIQEVVPHCYAAVKDIISADDAPPDLKSYDVILIGCPGELTDSKWAAALQDFVNAGGYLVTTDWSIRNLLQDVFPGFISHAGSASGDYPIHLPNPKHPFIDGAEKAGMSVWHVEGSSHLIKIDNPKAVDVLIESPKLGKSGKFPTIMAAFRYGKGYVAHFISHFHLQKSGVKGNYVSAYILTNIIDEAVNQRYGVLKSPPPRVRVIPKKNLTHRIKVLS